MRKLCGILGAVLLFFVPLTGYGEIPEVEAKSAVLMEVVTGTVLGEQNAHERLAPASVTKIMTMLLIMEAVDSGALAYDDTVTASEAAAAKGGSQIYLKAGETMTVSDMLKSIAVSSANDCACAMAEHLAGSEQAFVDKMNAKAAELGMNDTHFVNCTGLDDDDTAKAHRTSAYDIALMSRELLGKHPDIRNFTTIWMDTVRNGTFGLSNTNKLIRFYPGATGLKTGFTSGAGYCLSATAQREGMELIAVVMGSQTANIRNAACKALLDYGFAGYTLAAAELPDTVEVPVKQGKAETVALTAKNQQILLEKSKKGSLRTEISLPDAVTAPISAGDPVGTLRLLAGDEPLMEAPLTAKKAVPELTGWDMVKIMLRAMMGG